MILGQVIKGLNNEWDKQIEFREEERRIAEDIEKTFLNNE